MIERRVAHLCLGLAFALASGLCARSGSAKERSEAKCGRLHPGIVSPVEMASWTFDLARSRRLLQSAYGALAARLDAGARGRWEARTQSPAPPI